jgi:CheY-like chemotaxis protein
LKNANEDIKAREKILALLSHEMRTPLNGVLGMAGLLAGTKLDATQQAYLSVLRESGELLLSLVNDVLDLAKLDSRPLELESVDTDIERLLQSVCELLSPRAYATGIEIAWRTLGAFPLLRADDGRLRQILFNLAGNAIKLTTSGGVLVTAGLLATSETAIRVRFSVKDSGPGIAKEHQTQIFEEFMQTEAGARAGGAGLGLAIVRRLVAAFQGRLGVDSRPGEGAEFWVELDLGLADASPKVEPDALTGLSIAVLSPNWVVREAGRGLIEACGGRAETLADRAGLPAGANYDAVLIDAAWSPNEDAPAPPPGPFPAIVLLAPESRRGIEAFRAAGYTGYLIKPLRRASLAARVLAVRQDARDAAPSAADLSSVGVEDERAAEQTSRHLRVLLVEDNPVNALLARALLTREGCTVDRAATGGEALTALATAPYDIVLMDMRMPGMDGPAATRALRARGDETPIIAVTANAFEDDRRTCLEAGMNDFLTKPLDPKALQAALLRWARPEG